jgi:signal transduction histidine kinase
MSTWTWAFYINARDAALEVGRQHLQSVSSQMATSYTAGLRGVAQNMRRLTTDTAFAKFMRTHTADNRAAAIAAMQRLLVRNNRRMELFALDGTPLLSVPDTVPAASLERHEELAAQFAKASRGPDFVALAPLRILNDSVTIPIVGAILQDSQPIGYLTVWSRIGANPQTRDLLSRLIGSGATIFIGNARGDLWSDFGGSVRRFPTVMPVDGSVVQYNRPDSNNLLATARVLEGTPWAIAIEMESTSALESADQFLRRAVIAGILILLAATIAAWLLSRRITRPLHQLTVSAKAMASGDYSARVDIARRDEIGMLGESFNAMADRVGEAHRELELKVEERTKQLRDRNEDLEAFVHSVSHDLRAPLRAMHGFSQALLEDFPDQLDSAARDYAQRIAVAALRMDQLTQDLLIFSRVSRTDISLGTVELEPVLRDAVGQFEADIALRHAEVKLESPFPPVVAHRATLEQAVANLVGNALKFIPTGAAPEIVVRTVSSNGTVRIWVEDNGIGIDPAHQQRIFSVFERLNDVQSYAGTGMGLAIVRKAVERMGGRVGVESHLGAGSRFWIDLQSVEA